MDLSQAKAKWLLVTVPHSGTRHVYHAFSDAGAITCDVSFRGRFDTGGRPILRWGHFYSGNDQRLAREVERDQRKNFVVLRDPLSTLASHYLDNDPIGVKKTHLGGSWNQFYTFSNKYTFKYFNIERDGLEAIAEWADFPLDLETKHYSRGLYPLKEAVLNKDIKTYKELMDDERGNELLTFFYSQSRKLWPLYEKNGYEIWWE